MERLTDTDLKKINLFEETPLTAEQVYIFTMKLCNNEVDQDLERFSQDALEHLGELFVGKRGLIGHKSIRVDQQPLIYRTEVVEEPETLTAAGDPYRWVKAWAYLLRTEENRDFIEEIEWGIKNKKEVSVGCSMGRNVCSICGKEKGNCAYLPGKYYGDRLCYFELQDPKEVSEWAFVVKAKKRRDENEPK